MHDVLICTIKQTRDSVKLFTCNLSGLIFLIEILRNHPLLETGPRESTPTGASRREGDLLQLKIATKMRVLTLGRTLQIICIIEGGVPVKLR